MKKLLISLAAIILTFNLNGQVKIINNTYVDENGKFILSNHPTLKKKIVCEFYNLKNILVYHYEFITLLKELDSRNFKNYLDFNQIVLDGAYVEYYENGDTLLYVQFKKGNKVGKQIKFNQDKTLEEELLIINPNEAEYSTFYPSGQKKMQFKIINEEKAGDEIHYYQNGNIKLKIHHSPVHMEDTLTEYYPDKTLKRQQKIQLDKIKSEKCFDENGNESLCKPLIVDVSLENINEKLQELKSSKKISKYLSENDLAFNCKISGNGKILSINLTSIPDSIASIIQDWLINKTIWKPGNFANIPVISNIDFTITNTDSIYFLRKAPFNVTINNHDYAPSFNLVASPFYADYIVDTTFRDSTFIFVEEMPLFNGGSSDGALEYVAKHMMYPEEAAMKGIQGRVFVQFDIAKDGSVRNVVVVRGTHPLLDAEAVRVIKSMPRWRPGYQKGQAITVQYTFPVNFVLHNKK